MTRSEAIEARHSVRQYLEGPLTPDELAGLRSEIDACNREGGLHIQLAIDEPKAFSGSMARYGKFSGVTNYLALVGKAGPDLQEKCGYWGERLVLKAQMLGLNTCWVALTFNKVRSAYVLDDGEKLAAVIALGHGVTQGFPHASKAMDEVSKVDGPMPDWFRAGMDAVLLAPTAVNQQKFLFTLEEDGRVSAQPGHAFYAKMDLGIAKYHFELGAGKGSFQWK